MVTFQLPAGPKNLATVFTGVDFAQVDEYYLRLTAGAETLATTNHYHRGCCCNEDTLRVFFVNYLGGIDSLPMQLLTKEADIKSTRWKKPNKYPLQKWDGGWQRSNVGGLVTVLAETTCYSEKDMPWLEELKATPNAWLQWSGTQGQGDHYLPIVVEDGKFVERKENERYNYPFQLQFTMANELFILRN